MKNIQILDNSKKVTVRMNEKKKIEVLQGNIQKGRIKYKISNTNN